MAQQSTARALWRQCWAVDRRLFLLVYKQHFSSHLHFYFCSAKCSYITYSRYLQHFSSRHIVEIIYCAQGSSCVRTGNTSVVWEWTMQSFAGNLVLVRYTLVLASRSNIILWSSRVWHALSRHHTVLPTHCIQRELVNILYITKWTECLMVCSECCWCCRGRQIADEWSQTSYWYNLLSSSAQGELHCPHGLVWHRQPPVDVWFDSSGVVIGGRRHLSRGGTLRAVEKLCCVREIK